MDYHQLLDLAIAIAPHMKGGWRPDRRPVDRNYEHRGAKLLGEHGKVISLYQNYNTKGKIGVRGVCPDYGFSHQQKRNANIPLGSKSIRVSPTRNPRHIAADIHRRLLPDYEAMLIEAEQQAQRYRQRIESLTHLDQTLRRVSPELKSYQTNHDNIERRYIIQDQNSKTLRSGELIVHSYNRLSCDLKLSDLSVDTTFRILALIKECEDN